MTTYLCDDLSGHLDAPARTGWCAGRNKANDLGFWDGLGRLGPKNLARAASAYLHVVVRSKPTDMTEELRVRIKERDFASYRNYLFISSVYCWRGASDAATRLSPLFCDRKASVPIPTAQLEF